MNDNFRKAKAAIDALDRLELQLISAYVRELQDLHAVRRRIDSGFLEWGPRPE